MKGYFLKKNQNYQTADGRRRTTDDGRQTADDGRQITPAAANVITSLMAETPIIKGG